MDVEVEGYHPPKQTRSREKVERIKDALIRLTITKAFADITNVDIANKADVHVQSLYQFFEKGKYTIIAVITAEYDQLQKGAFHQFFNAEGRVEQSIETVAHDLLAASRQLYYLRPSTVATLHAVQIPEFLKKHREAVRQSGIAEGAEFLRKRGVGHRRLLVATFVNDIIFSMRQRFVQLKESEDGELIILFDEDVEKELERVIVRYLEPYVYPERFPDQAALS